MMREQRYRYEMFVRVRDYGMAHKAVFPESSKGGQTFARVTATVAALDEHLKNRVLARAEARRVKAATRAAVVDYMKTLAQAGRRVAHTEPSESPFRMPRRRSLKVEISTARAFIEEARTRQDQFVEFGLPPTFISDFQALVDRFQQAVDLRLSSKTLRREAQAGVETTLAEGFEIIRDLDVLVVIATRHEPILLAAYQTARRIEGQGSSSSRTVKPPAVPAMPVPPVESPAAGDIVAPPAAATTKEAVAPVRTGEEVLQKAS